jgi:hypothetical protein
LTHNLNNSHQIRPGLIVLFGSGEMSPIGRKIHEQVIRLSGFKSPLNIGILETPTGFEINAISAWPARMETYFQVHLQNYHPVVSRIRAWRKEGKYSTNDPKIVDKIKNQDYLYCGAGSPTYANKHLSGSLAYANMITAHSQGTVLCLGSATAIAMSQYVLPVYEIFKAGADIYWQDGLNFFNNFGLNLTVIPHWNNQEGEDFDTSCCYMGTNRFKELQKILPQTTIIAIEEETACIIDATKRYVSVVGLGNVLVIKNDSTSIYKPGDEITFTSISD